MTSLGKPSCDWRSRFLNAEAVELFDSSCYYFDEVLNAFRWCLQPDGKAVVQRDQLPTYFLYCHQFHLRPQIAKSIAANFPSLKKIQPTIRHAFCLLQNSISPSIATSEVICTTFPHRRRELGDYLAIVRRTSTILLRLPFLHISQIIFSQMRNPGGPMEPMSLLGSTR